jgi:hypothetical protein
VRLKVGRAGYEPATLGLKKSPLVYQLSYRPGLSPARPMRKKPRGAAQPFGGARAAHRTDSKHDRTPGPDAPARGQRQHERPRSRVCSGRCRRPRRGHEPPPRIQRDRARQVRGAPGCSEAHAPLFDQHGDRDLPPPAGVLQELAPGDHVLPDAPDALVGGVLAAFIGGACSRSARWSASSRCSESPPATGS